MQNIEEKLHIYICKEVSERSKSISLILLQAVSICLKFSLENEANVYISSIMHDILFISPVVLRMVPRVFRVILEIGIY